MFSDTGDNTKMVMIKKVFHDMLNTFYAKKSIFFTSSFSLRKK